MLPTIPQAANNWLLQPNPQLAVGSFPANLIGYMPEGLQKKVALYICQKYAWPQVMERLPFESMWDKILEMYRIKLEKVDLSIDEPTRVGKEQKDDVSGNADKVRVADSVVFDAVERLTNLTHFVSFKEGLPIQFNIPRYYDNRGEDSFYHPFKDRIQCMNALLQWNMDNEDVYRKHMITARHFYTYGVAFAISEFDFKVGMMQRMDNQGRTGQVPEVTRIGTTFDPISIRKLWLNWRLSASDMDYQPCPFFFDETPRFATLQNQYSPQTNPFGFLNLDKIQKEAPQYIYNDMEMQSIRKALENISSLDNAQKYQTPQILDPKHSVEALWSFFPMLPLDPFTLAWETYSEDDKQGRAGQPVPFVRYIVNSFGQNLAGHQILLRVQRNFYPRDVLPIYGTSHMPDLDSGLYSPSLGYLLWNHYREIVTCKEQYLVNKDLINDPPAWVQASSPAFDMNLNAKGARIQVNSERDFGWKEMYDGTQTTVSMMQHLRDQAQTTSKSTDAIMGKALGGRTSATEASNAFQASMSAVTTPINIFNFDIMGGWAMRVHEYTGSWFPPQLLESITGQMGIALKPQDFWLRVGMKWDVGSSYVENIVRSQNIQYILQSSMGDPSINRASMWKELLRVWRFDTEGEWVNDQGLEREVFLATKQTIETFNGKPAIVSPDQNHDIAIRVKSRFLEDQDSVYMTTYRQMAPEILKQIQIHQSFLQLRLHQQLLQMKLSGGMANMDPSLAAPGVAPGQPPLSSSGPPVTTPGQMAQQGGGSLV